MANRPSLQYSGLKQALGFRLLRVHALSATELDDAPIKCSLEHFTLAEGKHPDYIALSYCWGNPNNKQDVVVNGASGAVTVNLDAALRQLRRDQLPDEVYIWADALCINQTDTREKAKQIQLMPKIYTTATKVVTWLSHEDRDAEHLLYLSNILNHNPSRRREQAAFSRAISTLSAKHYWSRIWIVQELSLAQHIEVVCKDSRLPWAKFVQVSCGHIAQTLSPTSEDSGFAFLSDNRILELDAIRFEVQSKSPIPTLRALYRTRTCQSTIKADRVFAILGLTVDGASRMNKLKYEDSVHRTLLNLTLAEIDETGRLDCITFADARDNTTSVLRSWNPNWISRVLWQKLRVWQLHQILLPNGGEYFRASSMMPKLVLKDELKLTGYCLGSICSLQEPGQRLRYRDPSSISAAVDSLISEFAESSQTNHFDWKVKTSTFGLKPSSGEGDDTLTIHAIGSGIYRSRLEELATFLEPLALRRRISSNDWLVNQDSDGDDKMSDSWIKRDPAKYRAMDAKYEDELRALMYLGSTHSANGNGDLCISEMRFFGTSKGLIGLGHASAKPGDQVYLLEGCSVPVILRERKNNTFSVIGELLVPGIMKGEYFQKKGGSVLASDFKQGDKEVLTVV